MTSALFRSMEPPAHLCPFCSGFCQNGTSKKTGRRINNCNLLFVLVIAVDFFMITLQSFVWGVCFIFKLFCHCSVLKKNVEAIKLSPEGIFKNL